MKINKKNKHDKKDFFEDVPEDKLFWLSDGRALRNLEELSLALKDMNEEVFRHHVNKDKNDFRNWIKFVIGDDNLANDINRCKKKDTIRKKVDKRIKALK